MPKEQLLAQALGVLAKADSTSFEAERSALVYGSYVLLAKYLAVNPGPPSPDGRRRERRLVADRRHGAAPSATRGAPPSSGRAGARRPLPAPGYPSLDGPPEPAGTIVDRRI